MRGIASGRFPKTTTGYDEEDARRMSEYTTVAKLEDIPEDEPTAVEAGEHELVLIRRNDKVHALEDRCSHEDYPLHNGEVLDGQIECALHGARFEIESGDPKALPAVKPVRCFECRVEDAEIRVKLD